MNTFHEAVLIESLIQNSVLQINDGYRAKNSELSSFGVPFARVANIHDGFHFEETDCVPPETLARVGAKKSQPGDVVFTSKGTVGRFAYVRADTPEFVYSPQLCYWRVLDSTIIHPRWLFYWMQGTEFYRQFKSVAGQTDMAEYVSLRDQRAMQITLPPLSEQRAIADILGSLDDKIELNRRMNVTLEAMARALFKSWFVDFDPVRAKMDGRAPAGMDAATAALFPARLVDSELGPIPEGWRVERLGEVMERRADTVHPDELETGTSYIGLEHMPRRSIALDDWGESTDLASHKTKFERGDILFGKLRPYFHKVGVAPVNGVCSTDIIVVKPRQHEWFGFAIGHLSSDALIDHVDRASTGTRMPRASWSDIAGYWTHLPSQSIAKAYQSQVAPLIARMATLIHETRSLATTRDALLPKLLSGELAVGGNA